MSATIILIVVLIGTSLYGWSKPQIQQRLMMNPYRIRHNREYYRFISSGFAHSGYMHLFLNVFTFYFFGTYVERMFISEFGTELGLLYFLVLFIAGIVVSDLPTYFKYQNAPNYNSLGASGGVSSIVFAFILYNPTMKIWLFLAIPIPGFILGALYIVYSYYQSKNSIDKINHSAHLYGALFGLVFSILIKPRVVVEFIQEMSNWSLF